MNNTLSNAKILIVDDQEANLLLLEDMLEQKQFTNLKLISDPRQVLPLFESFKPDLLILDLQMPYLDGFAVLEQLNTYLDKETYLPILVLTADATTETKQRALASGAKDFLSKPFDTTEAILRINNLLQTRLLHNHLEQRVEERTEALQHAQHEILNRLAWAAEYRDDDTGKHILRVAELTAILARALGFSETYIDLLRRAARLHDVGKIAIPDSILLKPGKLTQAEFAIVKTHTIVGGKLLADGHSDLVKMAHSIALNHHEHWNGSGYPYGLKGEAISIEGRITAVADVIDALVSERPYKQAWLLKDAIAEIINQKGQQFDPAVVEALEKSQDAVEEVYKHHQATQGKIAIPM